jgi:hypothetical protein
MMGRITDTENTREPMKVLNNGTRTEVYPMPLVHVCTDQQPQVWRTLNVHAKLSGVPLRDYLTFLIVNSRPVRDGDNDRAILLDVVRSNRQARSENCRSESTKAPVPNAVPPSIKAINEETKGTESEQDKLGVQMECIRKDQIDLISLVLPTASQRLERYVDRQARPPYPSTSCQPGH